MTPQEELAPGADGFLGTSGCFWMGLLVVLAVVSMFIPRLG